MSDWPDSLKAGPIRQWPGSLTPAGKRRYAPFRGAGGRPTPLRTTLDELDRELFQLKARDVELLVALEPEQFRLDGRPRANTKAAHPGVILSFTIPGIGAVSYPCDTFTTWEDNLRAIVLSLESLRRVDRYGVTKRGEQYRGFLALEATAAPAGFTTAEEALRFLAVQNDMIVDPALKMSAAYGQSDIARILRKAQFRTHPDRGGDASIFHRVSLAETKLREEGLL